MTFPASKISVAEALQKIADEANMIKGLASQYALTMATTTVSSYEILNILNTFVNVKADMMNLAVIPGMDTYAQAQLGQTVTTDFTSMITALTNAGAWIVTNFPKDSNGYLLSETFNSDGSRSGRNFTTTQLAPLVTLLNDLTATIT